MEIIILICIIGSKETGTCRKKTLNLKYFYGQNKKNVEALKYNYQNFTLIRGPLKIVFLEFNHFRCLLILIKFDHTQILLQILLVFLQTAN